MSNDAMPPKHEVPIKYLHECFRYDPVTGMLAWKVRPITHFTSVVSMKRTNTQFAGRNTGAIIDGYRVICLNKVNFFAHRIAFAMVFGRWPSMIDHIDGDGTNNKISNLREVTPSENQKNKCRQKNSKTPLPGVIWHTPSNKWAAYIKSENVTENLGLHTSLFEAACARKSAERRLGFHTNHGRSAYKKVCNGI